MKPKKTSTLQLPFANPAKVLHTSLPREEQAVRVLCFILACLVVGYVALVSMSVVNVIASQEAADELTALRTAVSELEHQYFKSSQVVTAESGAILGLAPVKETHYVNTGSNVGVAQLQRDI
jgi:hypothetical protein